MLTTNQRQLAQLVLNADGSYDLHSDLSLGETIRRMRTALAHVEALNIQPSGPHADGNIDA